MECALTAVRPDGYPFKTQTVVKGILPRPVWRSLAVNHAMRSIGQIGFFTAVSCAVHECPAWTECVGTLSGPGEVLDRPMHEDALEALCLDQSYGRVLLCIAECEQCSAQHRGMREVGTVSRKSAELDLGAMLPQSISQCQNQMNPDFSGGPRQSLARC